MITFKSTKDISKLPPTDPAYPTVKELVKESQLWAWALLGAVMVPTVMHPGNLGLISIAVGLIFFGLPAFYRRVLPGKSILASKARIQTISCH